MASSEALADAQVTEFLVFHPDEKFALAWVTIEPNLAGGFNLWASASVNESRYGGTCLMPYWRADGQAARNAAWDLVLDLLGEARESYDDLPADKFAVHLCDGAYVLTEVPVPMGVLV